MPGARVHDPQKIKVSFAGRDLGHGRDEGDFVTTEFTTEQTQTHVGADGAVTVSQSADQSGKATINCMSTSDTHRILTALYERQRSFDLAAASASLVGSTLRGQRCASSLNWQCLCVWRIFGCPLAIAWNPCEEIGRGSTASVSTISGGSVSCGLTMVPTMWKSSITTKGV